MSYCGYAALIYFWGALAACIYEAEIGGDNFPLATIVLWPIRVLLVLVKQTILMLKDAFK